MNEKRNNFIYEMLAKYVGYNFKKYLPGTQIYFDDIFSMESLVTHEKSLLLFFNDDNSIAFSSPIMFIETFTEALKQYLKDVELETEMTQENKGAIAKFGSMDYHYLLEELAEREYKLQKLYDRLQEINKQLNTNQ